MPAKRRSSVAVKQPAGYSNELPPLSARELEILGSLVQMTSDGSGLSFGDWLESNPEEEVALAALEIKLGEHERIAKEREARVSKPADSTRRTLVRMHLRAPTE